MINFLISKYKVIYSLFKQIFVKEANSVEDEDPYGQGDFKYPLF
jgi:hypothetical protein